jgi:hypothetical protein
VRESSREQVFRERESGREEDVECVRESGGRGWREKGTERERENLNVA